MQNHGQIYIYQGNLVTLLQPTAQTAKYLTWKFNDQYPMNQIDVKNKEI